VSISPRKPLSRGEPAGSGRVKVLYLVGKGRSGGTLLNNLLGQIDGFVSPGELTKLWTRGLQERWLCGCGAPVPECPFWKEVLGAALDPRFDPDVKTIAAWQNRILSWRAVPRMLAQPSAEKPRWDILRRYVDVMARIYKALADTAGVRVIVESTRLPASPTALGIIPGVDSYVLHLVRDPRAVIYSWKKRDKPWVDRPGTPSMEHFGATYSVASWWARSFVAEMIGLRRGHDRYVRYRYESLIARLRDSLRSICQWLGEPEPDLSFISDDTAVIGPTHTVGGNPNRLRTGRIEIRLDDEWLTRQPTSDRMIATVLSTPFLQLYGYPLVPRRVK
jgi:hypothetical protein